VDPCDATVVATYLSSVGLEPKAILTTHRHWDHCGGNKKLRRIYPQLEIYGSEIERAYGVNQFVKDEEEITIGSLSFTCFIMPGHTVGHTLFKLNGSAQSAPSSLFVGDLLFLAGCGKYFEGTASTMLESLDLLCGRFDDQTLIWPGHEYAKDGILFASSVDQTNASLQEKRDWVFEQRQELLPTCPSRLGEEKSYNPWLRTGEITLLRSLGLLPPPATFTGSMSLNADQLPFVDDDESSTEESKSSDLSPTSPLSETSSIVVDRELRVRALRLLRKKKDKFRK